MKIALVLFVVVSSALSYPQHNRVYLQDGSGDFYQDPAGQVSNSFSAPNIQQVNSLRLIPIGNGALVPLTRTETIHTSPEGQVVSSVVEAGPDGAKITGSHVPMA